MQDAQKAIPKGTLLAIVITGAVYLMIVWTAGGCMVRDAIGPVAVMDLVSGNTSLNDLLVNTSVVSDCSLVNGTCKYGLMNDKGVSTCPEMTFNLTMHLNYVDYQMFL